MTYIYYNVTSNMTGSGNQTTILTFVKSINDTMNGFPAFLILIAIGIVMLLALIGRGVDIFRSFAATSFAMLILTIILYPTGLLSGKTLISFAILCPLSIFILWVWGGKEFG